MNVDMPMGKAGGMTGQYFLSIALANTLYLVQKMTEI